MRKILATLLAPLFLLPVAHATAAGNQLSGGLRSAGLAAPPAPPIPDPSRVRSLRQEAVEAAARVRVARAKLDVATAAFERARNELEVATDRVNRAESRLAEVRRDLDGARSQLDRRAVAIYRGKRIGMIDALLSAKDFSSFLRVAGLAAAVVRQDTSVVHRVERLRDELERAKADLDRRVAKQWEHVRAFKARQAAMMTEMRAVAAILDRAQDALGKELGKFRFPVRPPYSYVDTFGAPRMQGTKWAHRHEGIDIFALEGTPLVAAVSGTVFDVGVAPLGGNKLWLRGPDGYTYYYAHLRGYAKAGRNGTRVQAGTVLGYVGTTGNARGTPPHVHFEVHQPSGAAINPYPTLKAAERAWLSI